MSGGGSFKDDGLLDDHHGVIPRTSELLGRMVEELRCMGWKFTIQASILEIYNEKIRDLLRKGE